MSGGQGSRLRSMGLSAPSASGARLHVILLCTLAGFAAGCPPRPPARQLSQRGASLFLTHCAHCHDGAIASAHSGAWGQWVILSDGRTVAFDARFLRESVLSPTSAVTSGYSPIMPRFNLTEGELRALEAFYRADMR